MEQATYCWDVHCFKWHYESCCVLGCGEETQQKTTSKSKLCSINKSNKTKQETIIKGPGLIFHLFRENEKKEKKEKENNIRQRKAGDGEVGVKECVAGCLLLMM